MDILYFFKKCGLAIKNEFVDIGTTFTKGNWAVKISFLVFGFGNFYYGQILRGLFFFLFEAIFIAYMVVPSGGIYWLSKGNWFQTGSTIGTEQGSFQYNAFYDTDVWVPGDDSVKVMLYGLLTIMFIVAFVATWRMQVKQCRICMDITAQGKKVVVGAADTFRAAAVDQLTIWAERAGVDIVKQDMGSDPASVAFDTVKSAVAKNADVVLIDTAGRLHNRIDLMNELTKIRNVIRKVVPDGPHEVLLVLDGSTGQNAFQQAKEFSKATDISALAITKLDGTAKGGSVISIKRNLGVPVRFIGVGEGMDDLMIFDPHAFSETLVSLDEKEAE